MKEGISDDPDVVELNENLIDLGFDPYRAIADYDAFGDSDGRRRASLAEGRGTPGTGQVQLGRVIFAAGARRVTAVKVALGQDPPGATSPTEAPAKEPQCGRTGKETHETQRERKGRKRKGGERTG